MSETFTYIDNKSYCGYRLPCGLCRLTNSPCPYAEIQNNYEITCNTEVEQ